MWWSLMSPLDIGENHSDQNLKHSGFFCSDNRYCWFWWIWKSRGGTGQWEGGVWWGAQPGQAKGCVSAWTTFSNKSEILCWSIVEVRVLCVTDTYVGLQRFLPPCCAGWSMLVAMEGRWMGRAGSLITFLWQKNCIFCVDAERMLSESASSFKNCFWITPFTFIFLSLNKSLEVANYSMFSVALEWHTAHF